MGYYADADGVIVPVNDEASNEIVKVLDDREYFEYDISEISGDISIWQNEKYWEEEYDYLFEQTRGLVREGEIELRGEDGADWKFVKHAWKDGWDELQGRVVYDCGPMQAFIGQIIDGFEDFLDRRGIALDNPERDEDENVVAEEAANIYGTDYGELQSYIEGVLNNWGLNW